MSEGPFACDRRKHFFLTVVVRRVHQHRPQREGAAEHRVHHHHEEGAEENRHDALLYRPQSRPAHRGAGKSCIVALGDFSDLVAEEEMSIFGSRAQRITIFSPFLRSFTFSVSVTCLRKETLQQGCVAILIQQHSQVLVSDRQPC